MKQCAGDGLRMDARQGENPALAGLGSRQPYPKSDKLKKQRNGY